MDYAYEAMAECCALLYSTSRLATLLWRQQPVKVCDCSVGGALKGTRWCARDIGTAFEAPAALILHAGPGMP
jgi:hypothetical protein